MKQILVLYFLIMVFSSVNAQTQKQDTATVKTFHAVSVFLIPRGGVDNFKLRWLDYLYRLNETGKLDKASYADYVFNVLVERDGSLYLMDKDIPKATVFSGFIKQEQKWYMGIMSGNPIPSLLKLKVPKELFERAERKKLITQKDLAIQDTLNKKRK